MDTIYYYTNKKLKYRCIVSVDEDCLDIDVPALNFCDKTTNLWRSNNRGQFKDFIF